MVELLVVISIIALLMAILVPALGAAREQAKAVVCMSNQRQLSIAFTAYTLNNKGTMPPTVHWDHWFAKNGFYTWAGQLYYEAKLIPETKVFHCPSTTVPNGYSKTWRGKVPNTGAPYAATSEYPDMYSWEPRWTYGLRMVDFTGATMAEIKLESIRNPANYCFLSDTKNPPRITYEGKPTQDYIFDHLHGFFMLHKKKANILKADMSVGRYGEEEILEMVKKDKKLGPYSVPPVIYPDGTYGGIDLIGK